MLNNEYLHVAYGIQYEKKEVYIDNFYILYCRIISMKAVELYT